MTPVIESWARPAVSWERATPAIRRIRPSDLGLIDAMHQRLSPESIYLRYFQCRVPSREELAIVCHLPPATGEALVATLPGDEEQVIGLAYYIREKMTSLPTAELGILVEDQFQGQGIGRQLWQQLHHCAQARQISRLRVLSDPGNQRIQHLIKNSGYTYRASTADDFNEFIVFLHEQLPRAQTPQWFGKFGALILQRLLRQQAAQTLEQAPVA